MLWLTFGRMREGIFDFWWNLFEVQPVDDSVCLQFLELLDEHLVAHASNGAPQFAIATRTMREVKQYQGLPLPSDHSQGGIQAAGESDRYHLGQVTVVGAETEEVSAASRMGVGGPVWLAAKMSSLSLCR